MRIAIIDCFAGISGDMTLGALINMGVPVDYLESEIKKIGLSEFQIKKERVQKHKIYATKVNVLFNPEKQPDRKYKIIKEMIEESKLNSIVKEKALNAFKILGEAEAKIHNTSIDKIHFHEVGAVDSLVDLLGSIIGFDYLKIDKVYGMPVPLGTGFTKTEHGVMPVPSPAAIEILKDYPVIHKKSDFEMTTPTGATLLKTLVIDILPDSLIYFPEKTAYGAGSKETEKWPNLLRLITAGVQRSENVGQLQMLETNIDDLNPEIYPYISETLLEFGAKDVFYSNVIMKKGRPGIILSILCEKHLISKVEKFIFENTTTIGIRKYNVNRKILPRASKQINSKYGKIEVKTVEINGKEFIRPEYEECKRIAKTNRISILDVYKYIDLLNTKND